MSDLIIKVANLTKTFKLYNHPKDRLKEALSPFRKKYHHEYHALRDISFEIMRGESIGILGVNGAGKSTLLKVLTGVLTPTSGNVSVHGRVAALLELGSGFNPELSGLENIFFQGAILGFTREEMKQKITKIVEFADIGEFIEQPVKTYSSGMFARLAFSIAINVDPDILIVDEALSVGDIFFQFKCFEKFKELKAKGVTVLFVTHALESVLSFCNRGIVLEKGKLGLDSTSKNAINYFKKLSSGSSNIRDNEKSSVDQETCWKNSLELNPGAMDYGTREAEIVDFAFFDESNNQVLTNLEQGNRYLLKFKVKAVAKLDNLIFAFAIKDIKGLELHGGNTSLDSSNYYSLFKEELVTIEVVLRADLNPGQYLVSLGVVEIKNGEVEVKHRLYDVFNFSISSNRPGTGIFKSHESILVRSSHG